MLKWGLFPLLGHIPRFAYIMSKGTLNVLPRYIANWEDYGTKKQPPIALLYFSYKPYLSIIDPDLVEQLLLH